MPATRQKALTLRGPRGEKVVVDLRSMRLTNAQRAALSKLRGRFTAAVVRGLEPVDRNALARLRARVRGPGNAALIVRFDCKWVRID